MTTTPSTADSTNPRIAPHMALIMAEDLDGPGLTYSDVANATKEVCAAFLIVDDAATPGYVAAQTAVQPFDLYFEKFTFAVDGSVVAQGTGEAVDPYAAVAAALNDVAEHGHGLKEGDIVLTGALAEPQPLRRDAVYTARFDRLGELTVTAK